MEGIVRAKNPPSSLISLATARLELTQATDVGAVATLVDRLEVVRVAARKARLSLEAQNDWATLKLEAERKAGGMLTELRRAGELRAGRPNADEESALSGFGISQQQSSRWQRLSTVPEDTFRAWLEEVTESGSEVTEVGLNGVAARMKNPEPLYVRPTAMPPGLAARNVVIEGDCLQVLATLPGSCVDALVTDPPGAISFMNASWDSDRGGRDAWVSWMTDVLRESLRVVKPGGYALVWSLPRTSHWTGWALEEAGWEIRDSVMHVFLQGMPKSLDAGKALDRLTGEKYQEWGGWGSGLKPAHETWWLARKPSDLSVAENLLTWGTGALNIEATRVYGERGDGVWGSSNEDCASGFNASPERHAYRTEATESAEGLVGRWPANLVLSDRVFDGTIDGVPVEGVVGGGASKGGSYPTQRGVGRSTSFGAGRPTAGGARQMGDEGGKSRYFVLPKASRRDRDSGVPGARPVQNDHIAVKSLALMRHLVRLVAQKGSLILDPFAGSGTTGVAAALEDIDYILIEREPEYVAIARARLGLDKVGE
ncbi:MAG: site-specific DNA-methyltransferase [Chloroflexi bacterium]|nr:site-specific DNA-methyltransferase [Chloroflexota bacterium]